MTGIIGNRRLDGYWIGYLYDAFAYKKIETFRFGNES